MPIPAAAAIVSYIMQFTMMLPQLMAAGRDVIAFYKAHNAKVDAMIAENRGPSGEDWDEINETIADLRAELHS